MGWNASINKTTRFKQLQNLHGPLTAALSSARDAFVLLDIFCHGWCYFYTLPMKPLFTNVTADPELTHTVISSTGPAKCFPLILFIFLVNVSMWFQVAFRLPITWSLHRKVGVFTSQNRKWKMQKISTGIELLYLSSSYRFASAMHTGLVLYRLPCCHGFTYGRQIIYKAK